MKTWYEFKITKEIDVKSGDIISKEKVDTFYCIKKPSRVEKEEAEATRAEFLSKYIRRGILPEAILSKNYSDQGGLLDQYSKDYYTGLQISLYNETENYKRLSVETIKDKDAMDLSLKKILDTQQLLTKFQHEQNSFYEDTAEFKAKTKLIEWLFVYLLHKKNEAGDYVEFFTGETFDDRLDLVEDLSEKENEEFLSIKDKAIFVISLFVHGGHSMSQLEIDSLIKENFKDVE